MIDPSSSLEKEFLHFLTGQPNTFARQRPEPSDLKGACTTRFLLRAREPPWRLHFHRRPASRQSRTTECRPPDSQRIARLWFSGHRHHSRPTNHGSAERASRRICFRCVMLTGNRSTPSEAANCYAVGGPVSTEQPRTRSLALFSVASTRVYPLEHQTVREAFRRNARRLPRPEQPRCPVRSPHRRDNRLKPRCSGVSFITRLTEYGSLSRCGPTKTPAATAGVQNAHRTPLK